MGLIPSTYPLILLFSLFLLLLTNAQTQPPLEFKLATLKPKISHLHFYFHDIVSGRNPTAVRITKPTPTSPSFFGMVVIIDDPLTKGPDPKSELLGRAQGMYASADQKQAGLLQAMNLCFTQGKYNGSVLTVFGHNAVMDSIREMPVVGGSGLFRFAKGFALAKTHWIDLKTGDAIVQYNVTVMHY